MIKFQIIIKTLSGLEDALSCEIIKLGGSEVKKLKRAVKFLGDDKLLYLANLSLRTALRVLVPINEFEAHNQDELYEGIYNFPWEQIFTKEQTFAIESVVNSRNFNNSHYVSLKIKDAIVDRFREKYGSRPNINKINPDILIDAYIHNDSVSISLDSSGISLDKRGYRKFANEAPINEVLAAGIIEISGWNAEIDFYDPMSGSGTFAVEAALKACKIAPGKNRKFSFQNWPDYNYSLFSELKDRLQSEETVCSVGIFSRDIELKNLEIIALNAKNAGVSDCIDIKKEDFFTSKPIGASGSIFLNPPYGERIRNENIFEFYKSIGDVLKQNYSGLDAWVISSNIEAIKSVGLKPDKKYQLMNGGLDAKLHQYKLYKGKI